MFDIPSIAGMKVDVNAFSSGLLCHQQHGSRMCHDDVRLVGKLLGFCIATNKGCRMWPMFRLKQGYIVDSNESSVGSHGNFSIRATAPGK